MKQFSLLPLLLLPLLLHGTPPPAPDFTVTTSDGQVKSLYQDYVSQGKVLVVEAFFTTCPPCAVHAPYFQSLYTDMLAAYPGQVEFMLLSTLFSDTNVKVAQYKTNKGMTMPGVGKDGGSITALQPYMGGQWGPFEGTPTFFVIAPQNGMVFFDIRGNTPQETMNLLQQKIAELLPKSCNLQNAFGAPLDDVKLNTTGSAHDTSFIANGSYELSAVPAFQNTNYTLRAEKFGNALEGLTTYDLVLMSKHILATQPFHCNWQIIAADLNCSASITTFDIVLGRKVILGISDTIPCGSWRFQPDSAKLSNGDCENFTGIKLGDVNAGPCNDSLSAGPKDRSERSLLAPTQHLSAGQRSTLHFRLGEAMQIDGFQAALMYDPSRLRVEALHSEALEQFNTDNYVLNDGQIGLSWISETGQRAAANAPLFSLEVTALQAGEASDLLWLGAEGLRPELYDADGNIHPLQLRWTPASGVSRSSIWPNPARDRVFVDIDSQGETTTILELVDMQGKTLRREQVDLSDGKNTREIDLKMLPEGLYWVKNSGKCVGTVMKY